MRLFVLAIITVVVLSSRPGWAEPPAESLIRSGTPDQGDRRVSSVRRSFGVSPGILLVRPGRATGSKPFTAGSSAAAAVVASPVQPGGGSGAIGGTSGPINGGFGGSGVLGSLLGAD